MTLANTNVVIGHNLTLIVFFIHLKRGVQSLLLAKIIFSGYV